MAETARATALRKISASGVPRAMAIADISTIAPTTSTAIHEVKRSMRRSSGGLTGRGRAMARAILPTLVLPAVPDLETEAVPVRKLPDTLAEPEA